MESHLKANSQMKKPISKQDVQRKQKENRVVRLIDIRTAAEYEKKHVPGAINIPSEQLSDELGMFGKDDTMICICNYGKERGQQAAEFLCNAGFENTFYLEGGTAEWCNDDSSITPNR